MDLEKYAIQLENVVRQDQLVTKQAALLAKKMQQILIVPHEDADEEFERLVEIQKQTTDELAEINEMLENQNTEMVCARQAIKQDKRKNDSIDRAENCNIIRAMNDSDHAITLSRCFKERMLKNSVKMEGIETQIGDKIRFDGYIAAPDGIRTFSTILDVDQGEHDIFAQFEDIYASKRVSEGHKTTTEVSNDIAQCLSTIVSPQNIEQF